MFFFSGKIKKIPGDGGVGKSCLMNRFVSNLFDENSFHTIGVEFLNKDLEVDGDRYTLQVRYSSVFFIVSNLELSTLEL